jgi:hypothetical protein
MNGVFYALDSLGETSFEDATLRGAFSGDGSRINDATFDALLDTRPLDDALGAGPGGFCEIMGSFGVSCEGCADGSDYCLHTVFSDLSGEEVSTSLDVSEGCG